jgi:hypothetical protein
MKIQFTLGVFVAAASALAFPVNTSFEAPGYSLGTLDGQNNWQNVTGNYQVVSGGARTGTQAVSFNDNTGVAIPWAGPAGDAATTNARGSVWVNVLGNSSLDYGFGLDVIYDGLSLDYSTVLVRRDGAVFVTSGSQNPNLAQVGNVGAIFDQYVNVTVTTDAVTKAVSASVNGVNFALPSLTNSGSIRSIYMTSFNISGSTTAVSGQARFDDYSFEAVPEPGTMLVLSALGAGMFARRKARRS